jgi:DNA topoisomerase-1
LCRRIWAPRRSGAGEENDLFASLARIASVPIDTRKLRQEKKKIAELDIATDPMEVAEEAGLRYVSDEQRGYTRKRRGNKFVYFDAEGKEIRDEARILRISRLAIPPAYTDVWICRLPNGHLQATGRDDRGRKQYRYHERWREVRDENKYERMVVFAQALSKIRRRINKDFALPSLPREKVLATVVQLLERTFIRVGNEEYARTNQSYGLTTLQDRHVNVSGSTLRFSFRGKSRIQHKVEFNDPRLARIVKRCLDLPGQLLYQYIDDDGRVQYVESTDVYE